MAITFYQANFAGSDFQIVLNDTNSVLVEQAAALGQIGRYILRYDVIFPNPSQYSYFNQYVYIGNDEDYLSIGGAAPVYTNAVNTNCAVGVYSCALELPALDSRRRIREPMSSFMSQISLNGIETERLL